MIKIKLLKDWKTKKKGDIISISENGAKQFVEVGAGVVIHDEVTNTEMTDKYKKFQKDTTSRLIENNEIVFDIDNRDIGKQAIEEISKKLKEDNYNFEIWFAEGQKSPHLHVKNIPLQYLSYNQLVKYKKLFVTKYTPEKYMSDADFKLCAKHLIAEENKLHDKYKKTKKLIQHVNASLTNTIDESLETECKKEDKHTHTNTTTVATTPTISSFIDYCLTHKLPSGDRHSVISRNVALYVCDKPDRSVLRQHYINMQQDDAEKDIDGWLKRIDKEGKDKFPFSIAELINFTKKYKISFNWKQVPEYVEMKKREKSQKLIQQQIQADEIADKEIKTINQLKEDVITLIALRKPRDATELIANYFMNGNHIYSTRDDEKSEMWIYENGIYVPQGKTYIKEFCGKIFGKTYTTTLANEVVDKIRIKTYIDQDKFFKTQYVYEIPILDGILNIQTRQLTEFTPDKIFFNKLPLNYKPEQKCEKITAFFKDILPDDGDVQVMFEIFGFLLLKDYAIEKAIMFNGNGRNGKGKTLSLMCKFVGDNNACNVPISSMTKDNFDLEDLFGKLVNVGGDTGKTALQDTGCFKELVGRDGVNLKRKFKRTLRLVNYAKHVFACNELPIVYDNTEGFWTKWILMDFPYEFKTQQEIDKLSETDKKNKKIIDIDILNKISIQDELNGLLNVALDGLDRILKNKDFSYSKGTADIKRTWQRRANSFSAFCEDCIIEDINSSLPKNKLKREYGMYCKKYHRLTRQGDKTIKWILENDYYAEEYREQSGGEQTYMWKGIKLKKVLEKTSQNLGKFIDKIDEK